MSSKTELPVYWKRVGYVAIENRNGGMDIYGGDKDSLDFKFDGKFTGDICPRFTVSILGLSSETINDLTVWNPADAIKKRRKVEVYAGYEKDGLSLPILSGFIFEAMPTNPPEMWLNITCLMNFEHNEPIKKPYVKKDITLQGVLKAIADEMELKSRWDSVKVSGSRKVDFEFSSTPQQLCKRLSNSYGVIIYAEDGVLIAADRRGYTNDVKNAYPLSIDNGLLGIGNVSLKGATLTRRLENVTRMCSWIKLTSKLIPSADGYYFVISRRLVGHFRGQEWYTELEMIRKPK